MGLRLLVFVLMAGFAMPVIAREQSASKPERIGDPLPRNARSLAIPSLESEPEKYEGKKVLLEGTIERQCGHGRWFWVSSAAGAEKVVRFACGCSGKAWDQSSIQKKSCPYCGPAMPDCGAKLGTFLRAKHRVYVDSRETPITPRPGRKVRVWGVVTLPKRRNPGPWIVLKGIEILPAEPKPKKNLWKCSCTGKTWEQGAQEKKACPYCGPAMAACGTLVKVIYGRDEEKPLARGCSGCDKKANAGGCGGCGEEDRAEEGGNCSENQCANCRGDDLNKAKCGPAGRGASPPGPSSGMKAQTHCPVMGGAINRNVYSTYKGWKVYFCCPGCDRKFESDPEGFLQKMRESGVQPERTR